MGGGDNIHSDAQTTNSLFGTSWNGCTVICLWFSFDLLVISHCVNMLTSCDAVGGGLSLITGVWAERKTVPSLSSLMDMNRQRVLTNQFCS